MFETLLLLRDGRVQALEGHLQRLEHSTRQLYGLPLPSGPRAEITAQLTRAAAESPRPQRARIDAVPHAGRLRLSLVISAVPAGRPVSLAPLVIPGGLGAHKWCDRRLVEPADAQRVPLIVDADGSVLEAAWANIFILEGDDLITPPLDGRLLPGVTRARLLALAPRLGLRVRETPIMLTDARAARTMLLTSSLRLAVPASFARHPQGHPGVDRLRDALAAS
ncbi:MAG TPA: aminotransferase class IV [Solirubrobacteraceae bacterium]|nr:aminotransferase class IV [Solirubrobacteraceae bacterium]